MNKYSKIAIEEVPDGKNADIIDDVFSDPVERKPDVPSPTPVQGFWPNKYQIVLLIMCLCTMGCVSGFERTLLPLMAEPEFNETSETTILGFVVTYGLSKAITNGFAGGLGDKIGRKKLLILGMIVCLPVPIIILIAPNWWWVIIANLGLGSSQGLIGSAIIVMMIELWGQSSRGIAVAVLESSNYCAMAIVSFLATEIAERWGYRPVPFIIAACIAVLGLLMSFFTHDTMDLMKLEQEHEHQLLDDGHEMSQIQPPLVYPNSSPSSSAPTINIIPSSSPSLGAGQPANLQSVSDPSNSHSFFPSDASSILAPPSTFASPAASPSSSVRSSQVLEIHELSPPASSSRLPPPRLSPSYTMKENLEDFDEELERQEDLRLKEAEQKRMAEWAPLLKSNNPHPDDEEDENNLHSPFPSSSSSSSFGAKVSSKAKKWGRSCRASSGYYLRLMAKCLRTPNIASCTFGGMINNIKDGVAWGVIPLFFRNDWQVSEDTVAILLLIYPLTWGILELFSGALSDRYGRKWFMASGLTVQSFALGLMVATPSIFSANAARVTFWMLSCFLLGLGTALGYPVFQAAISDEPPAELRGRVMGLYRFVRDMGYVIGAILSGLVADAVSRWGAPTLGRTVVIGCAAGLLFLSAAVLAVFFRPHPNPITHHHAHPCVSRLPSICSGKRSGVSRFTL